MSDATNAVLADIAVERAAQDALFGEQDLPDGTGGAFYEAAATVHRSDCDAAFICGVGAFSHVFLEEVYEALAESDPVKLRAELVQAVAVGVKWIEAIDRRSANG